ncbi:MAG: Fe-S protein assembly co-chaperone HscB [Sulfuricellaceae bacterium]|nr:Fe-S protein assembly co-chaperone HscB [Sulfuricellaceae bacterium]
MQPDFSKNHFELFGLPVAFNIDSARMEQAYRDIQTQVHPDKFAHLSEQQRRLSMQWATHANEAVQTLKKPLARARYLLGLHGVDTEEESNTSMPSDFLMAQMEWREEIMDAKSSGDLEAMEQLHDRLRKETRQQHLELGNLLDGSADYAAAAGLVRKLKFMEKLGEEIERALESLEA